MDNLQTIYKKNGIVPKYINQELDIFTIPNASDTDIDVKGYQEVANLFCDSSGFGAVGESALTPDQLLAKVKTLKAEHKQIYAVITGEGQFQVHVTVYKTK